MKLNLPGKIRNTLVPQTRPLLPLFEAVINSFQALDERNGNHHSPAISITVEREPVLTGEGMQPEGRVTGFVITDNGVGFNAVNLESFFISDSEHKASQGGKGVGRFSWLKAFDRAQIESHYENNGSMLKVDFPFTMLDEPSPVPSQSLETSPRTEIRLIGMKKPYFDTCPASLETIGRRIVEHCLPFFLSHRCPTVHLKDINRDMNLNDYFHETFAANVNTHVFSLQGQQFQLRGLRIYNPQERHHRLIYAANSREVITERLEKHMPNLQAKLSDQRPFVYLGFLESPYFDSNLNMERTMFSFPLDEDGEDIPSLITLKAIRRETINRIAEDLKPFLESVNANKKETITRYISEEAPQYRPLLRYLNEFIDRIPPGAGDRVVDMALHEQMYEKQKQLKQESRQLIEDNKRHALKPKEYGAKLNDFIERANEIGKSSLAEYVVHRKVILDFLEESLQTNPETGGYELEETIHKIIYPMRTTSDDVPYEQQNLWIIDERLAYHRFLSSDLKLKKVPIIDSDSEYRPDILIFEHALAFAEGDLDISSIVIVEFKKPGREAYEKEDPVDQVYRLIREIRSGQFKDKNGRQIQLRSKTTPAYAYVICDPTSQIELIAENKDMRHTPDNLGYYTYNANLSAYVEIIPYTKLLLDAKKRNRVLFDKLNLPTS